MYRNLTIATFSRKRLSQKGRIPRVELENEGKQRPESPPQHNPEMSSCLSFHGFVEPQMSTTVFMLCIGEFHFARNQPSCPASCCKDANAAQEDILPATLSSAGVTGNWTHHALRCAHCGCVYSVEGASKTIRGYLNNPVIGGGWRLVYG